MQSLKSLTDFSHKTPFLRSFLSSLSTLTKTPKPLVVEYLTKTFNFPETLSNTLATRFHGLKSLEKPKAIVQYLQNLGFSDKQIQSLVRGAPQILISDINKILKPKVEVFQQLGLDGFNLGKFFSKTSKILTCSVDRKLVPSIQLLKKILGTDERRNREDLIKVLKLNYWLVCVNLNLRLLPNIRFLESCGIVGDQLAMVLRRQPRLLTRQEAVIRGLVLKVTEMGFDMNSRMFVHALIAASSTSVETFERKYQIFKSFGFSKDGYMEMVKKLPNLLNNSMEKSRIVLDFYLNTVKSGKEKLICNPAVLMYSMEKRTLPRYRVHQIIESKQLSNKMISVLDLMSMCEDVFVEKFILKFPGHAEELLMAYKGDSVDCCSGEKMCTS